MHNNRSSREAYLTDHTAMPIGLVQSILENKGIDQWHLGGLLCPTSTGNRGGGRPQDPLPSFHWYGIVGYPK